MPTFFPSTSDIPVPEVLGGALPTKVEEDDWQAKAVTYLDKVEKHVETLSRGLNATAQFAWGEEVQVVNLTSNPIVTGEGPLSILRESVVMPSAAKAMVSFNFTGILETAPTAITSFYAGIRVDGKVINGCKVHEVITTDASNVGLHWSASGSCLFEMEKLQTYRVELVAGWADTSTSGELKAVQDSTSMIYRLTPRVVS